MKNDEAFYDKLIATLMESEIGIYDFIVYPQLDWTYEYRKYSIEHKEELWL